MDSYYDNTEVLVGEECEDPHCHGCQKPIEDGSVVQFGDGIWHFECFRCAKCHKLVECYSNLLLLRDGNPICEDCSYSCHACKKTIKDEAIMTGDEAYHAECFRCVQCNKKINDLVFTQTSKGIYCTKCHETRKQLRMKKRDERNNNSRHYYDSKNTTSLSRPPLELRTSSTTSIVNAYTEEHSPLLESNDINELNNMLMGQRNSEETPRSSIDNSLTRVVDMDQLDDTPQVHALKHQLIETKNRLREVEGKFNKIKTISRKALDEFNMVKEGYAHEVQARREAENQIIRLKSELLFYQQANIFNGHDFIHYSKEEIEALNQTRADLEQICYDLRSERDNLIRELETHSKNIEKLLASQKPQDLHWERIQHAYQQQLNSMQKDMTLAKESYARLVKGREEIISDMILLNTKNAELTQLNNDLSRRVIEREQEAKAVFAGTSFLTIDDNSEEQDDTLKQLKSTQYNNKSNGTSNNKHRRNLSTGSIGIAHPTTVLPNINNKSNQISEPASSFSATAKLAQLDSFSGSAAPRLFKFRRNKSASSRNKTTNKQVEENNKSILSISYDTKSLELASESFPVKKDSENPTVNRTTGGSKHHFIQTKFLRPIKCESCGEKMWRVNELKCSECSMVCHAKCAYSVPQVCFRKNNSDANNETTRLMFGNDLIKQIQAEKGKIPLIVEKCVESVEKRGMDYEGIYRKSGGVGQMRQIQQAFEKGEVLNLADEEKWNDICAITSVLKQYFRELPNPLFTYELHSKFMDAMMITDSKEQLQTMTQLIQMLPIENFNTLKYLMEHLNRVQSQSKDNLMTSKNLAVIFGPTLLRHQDENRDLLEMNYKIGAIEFILNHMETIFVIETIGGNSSNISEHRRAQLPPFQKRNEDLNTLFNSYQISSNRKEDINNSNNNSNNNNNGSNNYNNITSLQQQPCNNNSTLLTTPAVPPRQNAGYI
ncbi:uncharacterized protein BX663DRAFT_504733 [Cokeromyces recurvatus]|uniref:uncharacterized protein n=1 Tax=Cokeromyces recurvatus TaxID=90255 RepID=UPI002221298A|nr:uncharacterized protein BX663DRAFT_504733 [Cokeromyces recurvatus]KAI7904343.1 hypothetical protein BX663DRAFT_504733 [Cokeromyces recurvatus]